MFCLQSVLRSGLVRLAAPVALVVSGVPVCGAAAPVAGPAEYPAWAAPILRDSNAAVHGPDVHAVSAMTPIFLTCRADVAMPPAQRAALCDALRDALAARIGAARLRDAPAPPGAPAVTLRLTRADARVIEGHLEWRANGRSASGPPVMVSADDMPLGPVFYPNFANGLLQVSKLPF